VLGGLQAKGLGATAARQHFTEFGTMVARTGDRSRITRNDAGHPIDPTLDHQTLGPRPRPRRHGARTGA